MNDIYVRTYISKRERVCVREKERGREDVDLKRRKRGIEEVQKGKELVNRSEVFTECGEALLSKMSTQYT